MFDPLLKGRFQRLGWLAAIAILAGCTGYTSRLSGNIPRQGSIVPDSSVKVSPSLSIPLESLVNWGIYTGTAYLILDPLAPNWEIEEARMPNNHIHLSLRMRRYYSGGAGEARVVFNRRAKELVQSGGFDGYEVVEYSEGLESSVLGSQRVSQGVIRLSGVGG